MVHQEASKARWRLEALDAQSVAMLGVPFDGQASYGRGPAQAPQRIRQALYSGRNRMYTEGGLNLDGDPRWRDVGDLVLPDTLEAFAEITEAVDRLLAQDCRVLSLGGDHSITYPLVRAFARRYGPLQVLQLDAHPDIRDQLDGNRYSHACQFARIMEEGLASRLVQVGIRFTTPDIIQQWQRFGVEVVPISDWYFPLRFEWEGPVYISVDIDVLDPAFAPGVSVPEPGGLTTRQVLDWIQQFKGELVGADLVEYNPERDPTGCTAVVAAKVCKELVARLMI
ncbi:MAG: agmatinase [Anaerolineae bacterium]